MKTHSRYGRKSYRVVLVLVAAFLSLICFTASAAFGQVTGDSRWPGLNPVIPEPSFPALCNVVVGSNGEPAGVLFANQIAGSLVDVPDSRLQGAINACQPSAGQPAVGLELKVNGSHNAFVIGPITLQPGVTLIVDADVVVFVSPTQSYGEGAITIAGNSTAYTGGTMGYWGIMGYGIIDGQGSAGYGARLIQMADYPWASSDYFTLYKITLQNGGKMHVYGIGNNFLAYDVKVVTPADTANTDGIDPSGSYNVTIANSFISDGDDHIALKAGVAQVSNVTIAHDHLYSGHGISVGSETNAGLTNMLVTDVAIDNNGGFSASSKNSLRIKSADNEGGPVNNVLYDGVCIENGGHLFIFDPYYDEVEGGSFPPNFQAITLRDVNVVNADVTAHNGPSTLRGYSASVNYPLSMTLDNVVFDPSNDLYDQFPLGTSGTSPTEYGVSDANFTLGPGPVGINWVLDDLSGMNGISVVDNSGTNGAAPYDCSKKYTYLAGELFGSAATVGVDAPVTLTAIIQPTVASSMEGSPGYVAPAPGGVITIYDNGAPITSQTVTPPRASYLCSNGISLCSSQRSVTDIVIPSVSAGVHVYTAAYSSDAYYLPDSTGSGITAVGGAYNDVIPVPPTFPSFTVQASEIAQAPQWVTPVVTATGKSYDGTAYEPAANITCTLTPAVSGLGCAVGAAVFTSITAGVNIPVSVTGIYLTGAAAGNYALTTTTATASASILPIVPSLVVTCTPVTYDGNPHSCTGAATGIGGVAVDGVWSFSPASETAVGSYTITGTFTSYEVSYASGGKATGTLVINPAVATSAVARAIPYMTSLFAGVAGQNTGTAPYVLGALCTNGTTSSGRYALDQYGDGCLATEAVMYETYAVVFDSAGNSYVANYDPSGFSFVQKIDAVTGVISMFAGGLSTTTGSGDGPCGEYYDPNTGNFGPDPMIMNLSYASWTAGDGCPAEDPNTGQSYSYFKGIRDLSIDSNYLYISDSSNSKIRKVGLSDKPVDIYHSYAHEVEPVAGTGTSGWSQDGPVSSVKIKNPYSVAVDAYGNVYFGDQSGNSIRRVTPTAYTFSTTGSGLAIPGNVTTVLNCSGSGTTCVQPASSAVCPSGNPAGSSRNIKTYAVTGMAFDADGNMYYAAQHCYSFYKIAANSSGQIDGSTAVTTVVGVGSSGSNLTGSWIPAFGSGYPLNSVRGVTSAGGNNMYLIGGTEVFFYDASDITPEAPNGWLHQFWGNDDPGYLCSGSAGTSTYFGCPAGNSSFAGGSSGGKGSLDPYGNLYVADGGDNLVLKAATGLDLMGTGPRQMTIGSSGGSVLIHGQGISDDTVGVTSPFVLSPGYNFTDSWDGHCRTFDGYGNDGATECVYDVTYVPTASGLQEGTLYANGTAMNLDGYGQAGAIAVAVTCSNESKNYGQSDPYFGYSVSPAVWSWSVAPVCGVTGEGGVGTYSISVLNCAGLAAEGYGPFTCNPGTLVVNQAAPVLSAVCGAYTYDGTAKSCTGSATDPTTGAAVSGSFIFGPGSETAIGSYQETGTFYSGNPNYLSGGTVTGTLTISAPPAAPPSFTPEGGRYETPQTVTITDETPGATIYYTTDGTIPTVASAVYTGPITISSSGSIRAMATASGYSASAVGTAVYTIGLSPVHEWTWMGGTSEVSGNSVRGVYGTLGSPSPENQPGSRESGMSWTDGNGNLWLFGGYGVDSNGNWGLLNDLWEFSPENGMWVWMGGTSTNSSSSFAYAGVYGTLGVPSPENQPGSREGAMSWTDGSGNLWLFGGWGFDANGTSCMLDDLWMFNPLINQWTWEEGSSTVSSYTGGQPGVYGTLYTAATGDGPGSRYEANSWSDPQGNLWLFGGWGYDSTGYEGELNDLWRFSPSTGLWTWMGGNNTAGGHASYGTLQTAAAGNTPGGRYNANSWTDSSGNLWLFGGYGYDSSSDTGWLVDLWEFNLTTNLWTWMGGSNALSPIGQKGVYGALGTPNVGNTPGGRFGATNWTDRSGNFWMWGGDGPDSVGSWGLLNDLWEFSPSTLQWTWMGGNNTVGGQIGRIGVFGTLGVPAAGNAPGGRCTASGWTDSNGNLWLFGGEGVNSYGDYADLNDLWEYQLARATTPKLIWQTPAAIIYGTPLSGTQLDATATVPGTFTYTPPINTILPAGQQNLSVTFTPADNVDYTTATATVPITVQAASPALAVTCPEVVYDGYAHSCTAVATGLGGAAVAGSFSLNPASETAAGSYPVVGTFTSLDPNYASGGTVTGKLQIDAVSQLLGVSCPGPLTYDGNAHSCPITGGFGACTSASVTNVPGSTTLALSCAGDGNHNPWSGTGAITINPATPTVKVTCPTVTYDGNPHSCAATATGVGGAAVSGSFTFTPGSETAGGSYPEMATFTSSDSNYANSSGSGTLIIDAPAGIPAATFSTTAVTFPGSIMIGQSSPAQYVTIMSTGTALLQVTGVTIGGANPGDFIVTNQAGTCTAGATLVNHADCNLRVVFAPTAVGTRSAILYISDNLAGSPQQVTVSGTAISGAQLSLSATTLTFPATTVGATAATQYLTLKSTGFQPVVVNKVVLSSGDFDLSDQAGTCTTAATTSLVPGADCNIRVKFHPTATGARTASVVISSNSPASPQSVSLNGTGQ